MTDKPKWFTEAQKEVHIDHDPVVIDRFGYFFHTPDNLEFTLDMEREEDIHDAVNHAHPCSKCFPNLHTFRKTQEQIELNKLKEE